MRTIGLAKTTRYWVFPPAFPASFGGMRFPTAPTTTRGPEIRVKNFSPETGAEFFYSLGVNRAGPTHIHNSSFFLVQAIAPRVAVSPGGSWRSSGLIGGSCLRSEEHTSELPSH